MIDGHKQAGPAWILRNVKEYTPVGTSDFPYLTEDWENILIEIRKRISNECHKCGGGVYLCNSHLRDFDWMMTLALGNVPTRYWPLEIEDSLITDQSTMSIIRGSCDNIIDVVQRGLGVSIFGGKGIGKTTLSIYVLKAALRKGFSGFFTLMESLLGVIKESFDSSEIKERFNAIKGVKILAIDDLGREYISKTSFVIARLDELLRWRDAMSLSTMFTSNLTGQEFKDRYGSGIVSLLKNTNKVLALKGKELRSDLNEWDEICPT